MIFREIKAVYNAELNHNERKAILLASFGSMLEYYDFVIFGLMATYVSSDLLRGRQIHNLAGATIFGIFFFSYLFRPVGMHSYSQWYNRGHSLNINGMVIALLFLAMLSIAIAPTSPLLLSLLVLVCARSAQGFARGAEMQSEFGYLFRQLGEKRSVAAFGLIAGAEIGVVIAMVVNDLLNFLFNAQQMNQFGWRIPFFIASGFCGLIYISRKLFRVKEAIVHKRQTMIPSYRIFRLYPKQVLFATLLSGLRASLIWMLTLLIPFFLVHNLHHSYRYIGHLMLASSLSSVVGSFIILRYTSPHQARKILHFVIVLSLPCLWLFGISITLNIHVMKSLILLGFIAGAIAVLVIRTIFGFFPSSTRLSSVSLCYSYGHTLVSGGILFAILLITELTHLIWRDVSINLIFLYATIFCISTLSAILLWLARHIRHFNNYLNLIKHIQSKHLI